MAFNAKRQYTALHSSKNIAFHFYDYQNWNYKPLTLTRWQTAYKSRTFYVNLRDQIYALYFLYYELLSTGTRLSGLDFNLEGDMLATIDMKGKFVLWSVRGSLKPLYYLDFSGGSNCLIIYFSYFSFFYYVEN